MNEAKPQVSALHGCSVGLTSKTQALFKNMKWNRYESQQLKGFLAFSMGKTKFEPCADEYAYLLEFNIKYPKERDDRT